MQISRIALTTALGLSLTAAAGTWALAQTGGQKLTAHLAGANEKPTPGDPKASGMATVTVKDAQVCYEIQTKDLAQPIMAHIHRGGPSEAGPVALALTPPDANGRSAGCASADAALAKDLVAHPGDYYVNVHTAAFKAGAIRGQLTK
jgi:hypothetical protein